MKKLNDDLRPAAGEAHDQNATIERRIQMCKYMAAMTRQSLQPRSKSEVLQLAVCTTQAHNAVTMRAGSSPLTDCAR